MRVTYQRWVMSNNLINAQMENEEITKKILELKMKAHIEDVRLEIQKLAQLADLKKEETKKEKDVK